MKTQTEKGSLTKRVLRFLGLAALCGLGLNALAAPVVGYVYQKQIITSEGVQYVTATNGFSTLKAALESRDSFGKTLILFADVTTGACVIDGSDDKNGHYTSHKKIILDLNGHNITCANSMTKDKYNNTDKNGVFCLSGGIDFELAGQGTVECTMEGGRIAHCFDNTGITLTVGKNVTLISDYNFAYIQARHDDWDTRYDAATDGTTINVSGKVSVVGSKSIDLLISTDAGIQNLNINLFDGAQLITPACSDWHFNIPSGVTGSLNVYPGSQIHATQHYAAEFAISSSQFKINITGGYFGNKTVWHDDKPIPLPAGYAFYPTSVSYCLYQVCPISAAKVGETYYVTLQDAVDNAADGSFIEMIANIDEDVVLPADKAFVLKGGDYVMDGSFSGEGDIVIQSGVFTFDPTEYAADTAEVIENKTDPVTYTVVNYTAMVGETRYGSFAKALEAAKALGTATVKMIADEDLGGTGFSIESGKDITIDLNGKDLTGSAADLFSVKSGGKLVLADTSAGGTGSFTHTGSYDFADNSGTIVVKGGTYNVKNYGISYQNGGSTLLIEGGCINYVNGTRTVFTSGGTKTVSGGVIYGTLPACTVTGGSFDHDPSTCLAAGYCAIKGEALWEVLPEAKLDGVVSRADDAVVNAADGSVIEFIGGTATAEKVLAGGETLTLVNAEGHYDYATLVKGAAACDLTTEVSEDGKTVIIWSAKNDAKCQAVIVDADGSPVYYATFADAVKGATAGGTVSVNREIAKGEEVVIADKDVTLDLAGQVVRADVLFTGDAQDFIIDSVGGGKVLGTISVKDGCTLKIYAGTFAQEIPAEWVADKDAEGNPLCVVKQDDDTFKVIANKVEVREIELTEENVEIKDEKGEPVPEEKKEAAQRAVVEANVKLQEAVAKVPPVDTGIEKASKESVVTPSGEVVAGAAKASVVGALQEALKEAAKTEDIPAEAVNQITATSDISERLEIKVDSEVTQVKDVTITGEPTKMEADLDVVVWDVKPIVKTVITVGEGEDAVAKVVETQLPDEEVKKNPVTFRLAVSDPNATGAYVRHIGHGEFEDETIFCKVQGPAGGRYVELTVDHFSLFEVRTTGEVVEELDDAIGIINLGVPGAGMELAAGVPFTTAGTAAKLDDLVMTGLASGDKILVQNGDGYDTYTFSGTTWGDVTLAPGTTFWYQSANGSEAPLTLAGLVTDSVSTTVTAGTAAAPKATLLVNPFNSAADLVAAVGAAAAEGDQIAFAGDNDGKDVRYVFKDGQWGYCTKPAAVTAACIYPADDDFNPVAAISVPGGKGAWYVSKGGSPAVAWNAAGAASASEQIAASDAQTYGAIDWFVALNAADMDSFPHEGIRLVGYGADGEKVFRYGRDFTADQFAASNTVFLGLGGGTDVAASFAVELLDAADNVIAVSEPVTDLGNALTATYAGSTAPVTATEPVQFTNFGARDNGEFAFLRTAFDGKGIVKSLADGCEVVLTNDVTGPVTLAGNLGAVTLDLNGHSITGTAATVVADAGSAIVIEGALPDATDTTALTIANTSATAAKIAGGNGADGIVAKGGAVAIAYDPATGVTVNDLRSLVSAGVDGDAKTAWAWCTCATVPAEPVDLPYGVSYDSENEKYLFWECDELGCATFDFAKVAGWDIADGAIHFIDGNINVDQFVVPAAAGNLTFIGGTDTVLAAAAGTCAFVVTSGADDVRAWTNLTFTSAGIAVTGGKIEVAKCAFDTCASDQFGGAIAAHALSGESTVVDSTFTGCLADDGGAIFATGASASGVTLKVIRSTFTENTAGNGGAISTQTRDVGAYALALDIANSTFLRNQTLPGCSGGAIAAQGNVSIDADATVDAPGTTLFEGNRAYVSGGAIALVASREEEACNAEVLIGRGVRFVSNTAALATGEFNPAEGGAIYIADEPEGKVYSLAAEGVLFKGNGATGADDYGALGGAVATGSGVDVEIDTCVFDGNSVSDDSYYFGGAVYMLEPQDAQFRNSTFRYANVEALTVQGGKVAITNCVAVGNDTENGGEYGDIYLYNAEGAMDYSAYHGIRVEGESSMADGGHNLANRTTAIYDGESLKLNPVGFNPVAVFGLTQDGVRDFEGTQYGYDGYSWSMGAFEAVTVKLTVTVTGDREYNGNTSSNGIAAFAFSLSTNGVAVVDDFCAELGDVKDAFDVTVWTYGAKNVGFYASTNVEETAKVTATVALVAEDKEVLLNALDFIYEGTISPTVNGLAMNIEPLDYAWTGDEIVPTSVTVVDTLSGETLVEGVDYRITYGDNVDPTDAAKVIVTGSRNYYGGTAISNFWITAYTVNHVFDGDVLGTEMFGATGGEAVVGHELAEIPAGYCFDWQNSVTNAAALKIGEGGLTAIDVLYWTDSNGDQVPDKFQKKITAKVVNGEWNDGALSGLNQTVWVTLATENGTWDAVSGTGKFGTDHATHALPLAGDEPDGKSQKKGGWIAFNGGSGYVTDPSTLTITADMTPILLYGYLAKSVKGGLGRGTSGSVKEMTLDDLAKQYKVQAALTSFSLDSASGTAKMAPKKSLMQSGTEIEPIDLKGSTVTIRTMQTLGGPSEDLEVPVDGDGNVTVPAAGASGFYQLGL